ncbi:xylose isomerase [Sansalvadorimonas sp. 2012CJ34-2]|uniref:Xylose isomerase n=1 Tax=Parendozoicomonas callyspongiae TaxID=2942213 RepID=A0ABT0PKU9_9GAMM|nr:xylose isomerase [Sansalvadorimonas sp. 2012CJ34-2]MCL6271896.1 xylose isomerase [Sansalvadorimonas sp. 2012CJ34-2]
MTQEIFPGVEPVSFTGKESADPLSYHFYDKDRVVLGKTMAEHLRLAVCYWHNFCWEGNDVFGGPAFQRSWKNADPMTEARLKADAAFEFAGKLGVPYYCFHDTDVAPAAESLNELTEGFKSVVDYLGEKQEQTGTRLLWGTANCFSHRRYMSGAASNPDPEIFACAANQVAHAMEATHKLGGENYVLWGGREGYETLLNTDLRQERQQLGRFLQMVVEHKHKIGFKGTLLIEPKPQEPTKHQYDYDVATVYGFLKQFGLEQEVKVNIEVNHATLAGHTFQHEVATAASLGILGSIDANRGDLMLGWDTDQFPNSVEEMTLAVYEILKAGGLSTGGFNFDAKLRRQSIDAKDLFHGHIGGIDTLALALLKAADLIEQEALLEIVANRYHGWSKQLGQAILKGDHSLDSLRNHVLATDLQPQPVSGKQEYLENLVNRFIYS